MLNRVITTESDGALNIQPSLTGLPLAIVGQCTAGTMNAPTPETDPTKVQTDFGKGRAPELAAYALSKFGRQVVIVRCATSVAADYGTIDDSGMVGSSTPTVDAGGTHKPNDDYEIVCTFSTDTGNDGTIGNASPAISVSISLDAGRSSLATAPLGTAAFYVIPNTNVKLLFGGGTVKNGDSFSVCVTAERANADDLDAALLALKNTALSYELVCVTDEVDGSTVGSVTDFLDAMHAAGKHKDAVACFRVQGIYSSDAGGAAESDVDYLAAFVAAFGAIGNTSCYVAAGAAKMASSITRGRRARRSAGHALAARLASVSEEVDISATAYALPGVTIRDANGNPDPGYYDESVSPGLDDARAMTLRTWDGKTGVFCNNPRLLSPVGSDFDFSQKRRVMNIARGIAEAWLRDHASSLPLLVNKQTGFLPEAVLQALEAGVNAELTRQILAKPKASSARVVLSRNDAILQPPYPLTGKLRMVPLAYAKDIEIDAGWELSEPITVQGAAQP